MDLDLDDIEAKAKAATPGPWEHRDNRIVPADGRGGYIVAAQVNSLGQKYIDAEVADIAYMITASPDVVLVMVKRIRELEGGLAMAIERGNCLRARLYTSSELAEIGDDSIALRALLAKERTDG